MRKMSEKICKLRFQGKITVLMNAFFSLRCFNRKTRKFLSPCRKYAVQTKYIVSELIQLSNVYINVKRPPKKYITFYEEVVINLG